MAERFFLTRMYVCTLDRVNDLYKPNLKDYPMRYCVVDELNKTAIDIDLNLKYDYIETMNMLYISNEIEPRQIENRRVAMFPTILFYKDEDIEKKSSKIIKELKEGKNFKDGNDILSNEEYLDLINQEKSDHKIKKMVKKGK